MRDSDQVILRRTFLSVLDRLERGARTETEIIGGANASQAASVQYQQSRMNGEGSNNPIIVIFLGQTDATPDGVQSKAAQPCDAHKKMRESFAPGSVESRFAIDQRRVQAIHPGLERFPISESEVAPAALKTCFMEPGRVCVNSGACEMRGY